MPRYVIEIGHDVTIAQPIDAQTLSKASSMALQAMAELVAGRPAPPPEMKIVIRDEADRVLATLVFSCPP